MKKLTITTLLLGISAGAYAQSAPSLKVGMALDQQLSALIEVDEQYRLIIGNQGAAFDYLLPGGHIEQFDIPLNWYVGVGAWAEWDNDFGVRIPLGVNLPINNEINIYGQIHPELNLYSGPNLQMGAALGITYRF